MIGIADKLPVHDGKHELHRLLGTLLSAELSTAEKLGIMETEYSIPADNRMREDVEAMCNLSQGIFERGEAKGEARGKAIGEAGIILNMYKNGYTVEQIASATDKSLEEIRNIVEKKESVLVGSE